MDGLDGMGYLQTGPFLDHLAVIINITASKNWLPSTSKKEGKLSVCEFQVIVISEYMSSSVAKLLLDSY